MLPRNLSGEQKGGKKKIKLATDAQNMHLHLLCSHMEKWRLQRGPREWRQFPLMLQTTSNAQWELYVVFLK